MLAELAALYLRLGRYAEALEELGYRRVVKRSDGEPALQAMIEAAKGYTSCEIVPGQRSSLVGASDIASNFKILVLSDYKLVFLFCRKLYAYTS